MFIKKIKINKPIPRLYGLVKIKPCQPLIICAPIPLNILMRLGVQFWQWAKCPNISKGEKFLEQRILLSCRNMIDELREEIKALKKEESE